MHQSLVFSIENAALQAKQYVALTQAWRKNQ